MNYLKNKVVGFWELLKDSDVKKHMKTVYNKTTDFYEYLKSFVVKKEIKKELKEEVKEEIKEKIKDEDLVILPLEPSFKDSLRSYEMIANYKELSVLFEKVKPVITNKIIEELKDLGSIK